MSTATSSWYRSPALRPLRWGARVASAWRRSLRVRVVVTTVALCLVVVALLGTFLVDRVRSGLLEAQEKAALAEAAAGARSAQQQFDAKQPGDEVRRDQLAVDVVRRLATGGGQAGRNEILLLGSPSAASAASVDFSSSSATKESLPVELRRAVQTDAGQAYTYISMPGAQGRSVPGLAVGERLLIPPSGPYELYYLFPLDEELATLQLVQRSLAVTGGALVLLVGLIAWLVTRQVVRPVRMAARTAERLAAGGLEERMHVRGEDDLARLATSFNKMATGLQRQIRQLEDLSRVQRRFVSDVSHELRTPLTTVRMAADVLHDARPRLDPSLARSAELLQTQIDRFEALLSDLLEISRFDAGAASLEAEQEDLYAVVARVLEATEPLAERKGSTITLEAPGRPCRAEMDSRRIERIVRNLVVNAIEHGEGRPIVVRVAGSASAVAVAVRDHGVGLPASQTPMVFHRFWRGDPARARTTGGTGLGLAISLEDAHLHGGWLQVWGEPGGGAQFRLTLPRRAGEELLESPIPLVPDDSPRQRGVPSPDRTVAVAAGAGERGAS